MKTLLTICSTLVVLGTSTSRKDVSTETALHALKLAVTDMQKTSGYLPSEQEGLATLIRRPADWPTTVPWEPRLATTELPRDGWGKAYIYMRDANVPGGFGIYSCGRDGVTLTGGNDRDDLNTWNTARPWAEVYDGGGRAPFVGSILLVGGMGLAAWIAIAKRYRTAT